ncbi:MAG: hypothetical protein AB1405_16830 [Bdellovibrionota bacterium]
MAGQSSAAEIQDALDPLDLAKELTESAAAAEERAARDRKLAAKIVQLHKPASQSTKYITCEQVAERIGMSPRWVRRHVEELGGFYMTDNALRFDPVKLEEYIKRRQAMGDLGRGGR